MADEKRLIDANTLLEKISSLTLTVTGLRAGKGVLLELLNKYRNGILQLVNEQPTVDAVEVVHGKMRHVFFSYQNNHYECTCCNATFLTNSAPYWNYCPNCGAKMDLEVDK